MANGFRKRLGIAAAVTTLALSLTAGAALAGEVTGNGRSLEPLHANSICAYSGLNDKTPGEGDTTSRVQSFGQVVKQLGPIGGVPGTECRGGSL